MDRMKEVILISVQGYELQVQKIGRAASEASGQPVLGVNTIGPYRMCKSRRFSFFLLIRF